MTTDYADLTRDELIERLRALEERRSGVANLTDERPELEVTYRALFDNMVEEVHFWKLVRDDTGAIVTWCLVDINPAEEKSWGVERADVVGKTANEIFDTAVGHFMPIVTKIFGEGLPYSWESYFPDLAQHMRMTSVPFGEYIFTTGFDVTELKNSSIRQEKLSMMARMATEASEIGVWELDLESGHLTWNEQMSKIFGTEPTELTNTTKDWSDRLHPDDRDEMIAKLARCVETGDKFVGNFRIVTPTGETRVIKARSEILKNQVSGSPIMIGTNIDITAQEDLIRSLRAAKELANQSNVAKSEFLANMSHELRTPMNAVLGYSQMLQLFAADRLSNREKQYLDHIIESGQHLLALIKDVLDLSQIEAGSLEVSEEDLDVLDIFTQAETIIRPMSEKHGISIRRSDASMESLRFRSDRIRVNQILINLLSNAIKYSPSGTTVTLTARMMANDRVRLAVTDTGYGIASKDQVVIFNPFTRLHGSSMTSREGIGIGLAVSKKLAEQLGGTIGVESQVGAGSTFWVEFTCEQRAPGRPGVILANTA